MNADLFRSNILELIRRTSAFLPADIEEVVSFNRTLEKSGSKAEFALELVKQNIGLAKAKSLPICQDTGTINFYVKTPKGIDQLQLEELAKEAVVEATEIGYLRQNSVDSITGKNTGNNLGAGSPVFHWHQTAEDHIDIRLILKGGGCENMSAQYSLPSVIQDVRADRNLEGVRRCILDAVWQAQGKGCGPGFLGVCIGGDRASGYEYAKTQLLRLIDDTNSDPLLAELENTIMTQANSLDIGPMGFSGKYTVGTCKVGAINRLPASYFVTIAYMCWAYRRRGVQLTTDGEVKEWLYQKPDEFDTEAPEVELKLPAGDVVHLTTPLSEEDVRSLKAGDVVLLSGQVNTARDAVHKYLFEGNDLECMHGSVIYHCGPVVIERDGEYKVTAAGPTTSIREEPYQAELIKRFGTRIVIGKGGMGEKTRVACQEYGCVYLHGIGGAAQIYANCIEKVLDVSLLEFGSPEAVWQLQVKNLPGIVTIDAHGRSLHQEVSDHSKELLSAFM
jgi:fumarate hydratase class I